MIWRLLDGLRGGAADMDMAELMIEFAVVAAMLLFCVPVHEFAHAWAAKKLGDNTAWMQGRYTLNPAKHLDLFGTLMFLVVGFGYAKPVPVNPRNFKNFKKGMALTAAAGPISNLILAVGFCLIGNIMWLIPSGIPSDVFLLMSDFISGLFYYNVLLMVFNLIPFPPLDGSRILDLVLPYKASMFIAQYEHVFRWARIVLLLASEPINWVTFWVAEGISAVISFPFNLIL